MANLQINDQRRVAPGQQAGSFAAPDASKGAQFAARQQQELGQAVSQAAGVAGQVFTKELEAVNELRVNDALNRAQAAALESRNEFSQLRGLAALEVGDNRQPVTDVYVPKFEQRIGEIAEEVGLNPVQRQRYEQQAQTLTLRFREQATSHLVTQRDAYGEEVYETGVAINTDLLRSLDPADKAGRAEALNRMTLLTVARAKELGLSQAGTELAVQTNNGAALLNVVKDLADQNVDAAEAYFEENYEDMTAAQREDARTVLQPARDAKIVEAAAAAVAPELGASIVSPGAPADFEQSMALIWPSEGSALVVADNGAGRSRFGITERSHPEAWRDGDVTQAEAAAIYKTKYWDAIGAGDLPAGLAHMAMDTAINMGPGAARELISQSGGDVTRFAELRRARYRSIAANDEDGSSAQYLGAWLERTDKVEREALGQGPTTPGRAPTMSVTQAVAAAKEALPPGAPPRLVQQVEAEVRRRYSEFDRAEAEAFEEAQTEAYAFIDANGALPPASILSRLKPGQLETIENYVAARNAPPNRQTDEAEYLALLSNPQAWQGLTVEEFVAGHGRKLSEGDLRSFVSQLVSANGKAAEAVGEVEVVPTQAYSGAWTRALDTRGIDRTPTGRTADAERQQLSQLSVAMRSWIVGRQRTLGRQLEENEIETEINTRLGTLSWERPRFGGAPQTVIASSVSTMPADTKATIRRQLRNRGLAGTDAEIWQEYLTRTVLRD